MTKAELNRDIKRLGKFTRLLTEYSEETDDQIKAEFRRLYGAASADKFKSLNKNSIIVLIILNRRYRIIRLDAFMITADIGDFL